jgi:hypothetical protein
MKSQRALRLATAAMTLALAVPSFAQRSHAGGGPPAGHGSGSDPGTSASHGNSAATHEDLSHRSPSEVLSHNTAIAGKIKALTGQDAATACDGFKNLGQCVAAAHVAKNLDIPGGFDALKAKVIGKGSVSLGKSVQELKPDADSKAEVKKANKQSDEDLREAGS